MVSSAGFVGSWNWPFKGSSDCPTLSARTKKELVGKLSHKFEIRYF